MTLYRIVKLLEIVCNQKTEDEVLGLGENICNMYIKQRAFIQNIQRILEMKLAQFKNGEKKIYK